MDRFLRPERFNCDPHDADTADQWAHWLCTFNNFLSSIDSLNPDKFKTLTNYLSSSVYKCIAECSTFQEAVTTLQNLYVQPKNSLFARHILSIAKQQPEQTLDQFLQHLRSLAKDCDFQTVTADIYRDEFIRDTFIRGLLSNDIRQRLLEEKDLTLASAFEHGRRLELAQKQLLSYNTSYSPQTCASVSGTGEQNLCAQQDADTSVVATGNPSCYFCGNHRHPRSKCPAREAQCKRCGKVGHFQRVCRSSKASNSVAAVHGPLLSALTVAASPHSLSHAVIQLSVNGVLLQALIDTGSSESYIPKAVIRQYKWNVILSYSRIIMATTRLTSFTDGHCYVTVEYKDTVYKHVKLSVMPEL
jgi:hypothetical protein